MKIRFVTGDYVSNEGLNYVKKTNNSIVGSVYGLYVVKAYENVILRREVNELLEDDTIYVVKQAKRWETYYTLLHELLHWIALKVTGNYERSRSIHKWIDKHLK